LLAGGTFLVIFGFFVYREGAYNRAFADLFVGGLCFATIGFLRTKLPLQIPAGIAIGAFGTLYVLLISTGQLNGVVGLWIFAFPIIAIFILGLKLGLIYSVLVYLGLGAYTIVPGLAAVPYSLTVVTRLLGVYFLISFLAVIYEQIRLSKDRRLNQLNQELRIERDFVTTMKDNLKIGLFLMNKELVIQGSYSKPLETILGTDEIEGKKLSYFLSASLKAKERDTLEDYFNMVLTRQFDTKMLEEINPIAEFTYVDDLNKEEKIIRTVFSPVDMGKNDYFVMGSMEDISATRKLERQLAEEAGRREEEMRPCSR
jgi:hypothetical protein